MKKISLLIAVFLTIIFNTYSQSPESFNYQSVIRDSGGNIISNQAVGLQFTIYQNSASGTMVYQETFTENTNDFGLINVKIGMGSVQSGVFADIDWASGPYFLETAIDITGGTSYSVMGTSQLLSVPYALFAKTSGDTSWSVNDNETGIMYKSGIVGIGTGATNAFEQFEVRMNESDANATNIRIYNLDDTTQTRMVITNDALNSIVMGINSSSSPFGGNEAFLWYFNNFDFKIGVGGFERMRFKNDGKIGIGTTSPGSQLQVKGGDIFIEDIGSGVIMKSPNGTCWRMTVDNSGNPVFASITCPL
jgi:hypothetical protein